MDHEAWDSAAHVDYEHDDSAVPLTINQVRLDSVRIRSEYMLLTRISPHSVQMSGTRCS